MTTPTTTPGNPRRTVNARRAASAGALALALFGTSVSAASAGTDESITTKAGSASFNHKDEIVTVNDTLDNKQGVMAFLSWKRHSVTVVDGNGANNSPNSKNLKIPERTKVKLKLCYVDNGVVFKCSDPQFATA